MDRDIERTAVQIHQDRKDIDTVVKHRNPDELMGDKDKGLYGKFHVQRTDGKSYSGEKHYNCNYFVLDLDHDKFAPAAIEAYMNACRGEYPLLAADLNKYLVAVEEYPDGKEEFFKNGGD